ncbi:hypothetical protein KU306_12170 [Haloferax larsenii]|uniref:Envelope protein N-terminal domain-containing protein n=1 Tax=Haloferax larsenii TaxID=302484 RepID=A0ABY5RCA5_HALLR|nr:hypothetical protein [Haloferax larsenii]UVE49660.1 hypothetical protein KU306_12170 [Haloferax larsenii]
MSSNSRLRQILSLAILTMVLTAGIVPVFFAGPAAAVDTTDGDYMGVLDCDLDPVFGIVPVCEVGVEYIDTSGRTAEQVHYDMYSIAVDKQDTWERQTKEAKSHSNQTYGIGLAEAKYTIIKELNNGSSKAEARSAAVERVNEFYAEQQKGLWSTQAASAKQSESITFAVQNTTGLGNGIFVNYPLYYHTYKDNKLNVTWETREVTLWDGETINVTSGYTRTFSDDGVVGQDGFYSYTYYNGSISTPDDGSEGMMRTVDFGVNSPYNGTEYAMILDAAEYKRAYEVLNNNRQTTMNQIAPLTDDIYTNYEPGDLDLSDVKSPAELVRTSITEYETTGDMAYPLLVANEMGYATNVSTNFDISYRPAGATESQSLTGTIATEPGVFPNDTIETGVEYVTASAGQPSAGQTGIDGTVWMYVKTGAGVERTLLNGTFTVTEMRDTSENVTINSTTFQSSDFATTDADNMQQQIDDTYSHRENISKTVNHEYAITLPGMEDGNLQNIGMVLGIGLVVLIVVLVIINLVVGIVNPLK